MQNLQKPNNVIAVNTTLKGFFRYWLGFLKPFHNLTERQMDVVVSFLNLRYELSKVIKDEKLLNENVMSEKSKRRVREECNLKLAHFQVIMGELRKNKVLIGESPNYIINPKFIPRIDPENEDQFQLLIYFKLHE